MLSYAQVALHIAGAVWHGLCPDQTSCPEYAPSFVLERVIAVHQTLALPATAVGCR